MSLTSKQAQTLSQCFLFQDLGAGAAALLGQRFTPESFSAGETIYAPNRFRRAMGILLAGSAVVLGDRDLLLNTLGPGQCFGAAALFSPEEDYVTTVRAKTDVELVFLTGEELSELFERQPQTALRYIAFLSERIRFLNRKIGSFTAPCAQEGLYRYLLRAQRDGRVEVAGGYSELARALNMGRASLYRSLDALEAEGLIRRQKRVIFLLEFEKES